MGGKHSKAQHEAGLSPAPPGAKVLRAPSSPPPKRVLFKDEAAASSPASSSSSTQGVAVGDICTAESTRRAEELKALEQADRLASADGLSRFDKYRNFFKNHETELARDVQKLVTRANKRELRQWVAEHVGELRALDDYGKVELVELAMVSAAIAKHGERKLRQMDERGELAALPNMPLNTHDLRMESKQQACRAASKAARKDEMQAAHYVGLEVMMTLNARLPVDARVGDELREILNDPSNLRLVLAASNQSLHKKADTLLMVDYDAIQAADEADKKAKSKRNCPTAQEYARLVQVAKHAQSDAFQDAMKAAGGVELYCSLRDQFLRLDVGSRAVIWDVTKDKIVPRGRPVPSAVVIQVKLKATANKVADKGEKPKPRASRSPSPAVVAEKTVKKSTATQQTRGVATAAEAKPEPKKTKAKKAAASKAEVASKTPAAAKKKAGEKKTKKAKDSPPKPEKENLNQENTPTTTSKKRPTTRRVTRSKGTAELVELPDTYSDGSEYVDESDSDYED